jgi:hypothetical protein
VSSLVALVKSGGHDYDGVDEGGERVEEELGEAAQPPLRSSGPCAIHQPGDACSPRPKPSDQGIAPSSDEGKCASKNSESSMKPSDAPSRLMVAGASSRATEQELRPDYLGHEGVLFGDSRTEVVQWNAEDGFLTLLFHADEREYSDLYSCVSNTVLKHLLF